MDTEIVDITGVYVDDNYFACIEIFENRKWVSENIDEYKRMRFIQPEEK